MEPEPWRGKSSSSGPEHRGGLQLQVGGGLDAVSPAAGESAKPRRRGRAGAASAFVPLLCAPVPSVGRRNWSEGGGAGLGSAAVERGRACRWPTADGQGGGAEESAAAGSPSRSRGERPRGADGSSREQSSGLEGIFFT